RAAARATPPARPRGAKPMERGFGSSIGGPSPGDRQVFRHLRNPRPPDRSSARLPHRRRATLAIRPPRRAPAGCVDAGSGEGDREGIDWDEPKSRCKPQLDNHNIQEIRLLVRHVISVWPFTWGRGPMIRLTLKAKHDHLKKVATTRDPVKALSEFVWNALDADATSVSVDLVRNVLGGLESFIIRDNGTGISRTRAEHDFESLG